MPNRQLHTAISEPRFSKYLISCGNNKKRALKLYRGNLILSQKLYAVIGQFEIILRNSVDRHYRSKYGNDWISNAVQPGGFLDGVGCENSYHSIQEGFYALREKYSQNAMVAKLTFGFWTYQYSPKIFAAGGSTLLEVFPNRPFGTKQKDVFQNLFKINEIRNRIAHYEPLCFDVKTGQISTVYSQKRYSLLIELLKWLGCEPKRILYGIDGVTKAISLINCI
ncbi:MAG TPA: hypothetical protein VFI06_10925 [Chitinophagaceae bacterium]|nr:hypothetical protein [Chitinophagaceae bacterium]